MHSHLSQKSRLSHRRHATQNVQSGRQSAQLPVDTVPAGQTARSIGTPRQIGKKLTAEILLQGRKRRQIRTARQRLLDRLFEPFRVVHQALIRVFVRAGQVDNPRFTSHLGIFFAKPLGSLFAALIVIECN